MMVPKVQIKNKDGALVQIAKGTEIALDVITQGVVSLVDNARKGTVEAITYTVVDTMVIIEATTAECLVRARLSKAERAGKACSEYLDKLVYSAYQPHVIEALATTYNLILKQELSKIVGKVSFEEIQFVNKN